MERSEGNLQFNLYAGQIDANKTNRKVWNMIVVTFYYSSPVQLLIIVTPF